MNMAGVEMPSAFLEATMPVPARAARATPAQRNISGTTDQVLTVPLASDISSSARHMSVMSTMPVRPGPSITGRCRNRPFVMTMAASRMLVVVLTTVGRAVISW